MSSENNKKPDTFYASSYASSPFYGISKNSNSCASTAHILLLVDITVEKVLIKPFSADSSARLPSTVLSTKTG